MLEGKGRLEVRSLPLRPLVHAPLDMVRRRVQRFQGTFWRFAPHRIRKTFAWFAAVLRRHRELAREPGLRVAVDVDPLWQTLTGVGWYLRLILQELRDEPDLRLRLYGPWLHGSGLDTAGPSQPLPEGVAIDLIEHPLDDDLTLPPGWQNSLLRVLQPLLVRWDNNHVVFAPNFIVPRRLRLAGASLVVTVHDLAMRKFPQTLADATRELLDKNLDRALHRASHIITPSETVRQEIVEDGLFPPQRVHAILHGPGHLAGAHDVRAEVDEKQGQPSRLPESLVAANGEVVPYVVHVGTIEPRKNLSLLLDIFEAWHARQGEEGSPEEIPRLVWCGGVGWKSEGLLQRASVGLEAGWLVRPGYVPDADLAELYRRSVCALMPSMYEGFGLPLVEAMAAGAPVLCSDIPVFREVVGDAGLLLPLDEPGAWIDAVKSVRDDAAQRAGLIREGRRRVGELDWRRCAEQTLEVWRAAAQRPGGPEGGS